MSEKGTIPHPLVEKRKSVPTWVSFVAGGAAGTFGATLTLPLEVVKTRLQATQGQDFGLKIFHTFKSLYLAEGIFGFFKGFLPTLTAVAPSRAVHFGTYSWVKNTLVDRLNFPETPSVHLFSAGFAGVTVATITAPIWLVKTRMQLQNKSDPNSYKSSWDCARRVFKTEGIRGFYRGLVATYFGITESSLQFVLYEYFKKKMQNRVYQRRFGIEPGPDQGKGIDLGTFETMIIAAGAKIIASIATYPHEVVRTRFREQGNAVENKYKKFWRSLMTIAREEGRMGLYGGMTVHLLRVVPNAAIMFLTFESVQYYLRPYYQ